MLALSDGLRAPAVNVPSSSAREQMEALFTARKSGWSALLRETLIEKRTLLRGHHGVTHPPRLMGMLKWWPINLDAALDENADEAAGALSGSRRGNLPQCTHFNFPVLVERRHLPIRERLRDQDDLEGEVVEVSNIVPPRSEFLYGVVATILLLLDKELCVAPVVAKKLAACGIVIQEGENVEEAKTSLPSDGDLDDFLHPPDSLGASPPAVDASSRSPVPNGGAEPGANAAVAARLAARQRAAAASSKAHEAAAAKKAMMAVAKTAGKRKGTTTAPKLSKRARLAAQLDSDVETELTLPPLTANDSVESSNVIVEANMVSDMTYLMMATNWCAPAVGSYTPGENVEVAQAEDWPCVVEKQASIDFLLAEEDLRKARQAIAKNSEQLRADGSIDAEQSSCIFIEATSTEELPVRPLTFQKLEDMGTIHRAGSRVQDLRVGVAWLEEAAK